MVPHVRSTGNLLVGVNITAFGWEIPLFDFHLATYPTFFCIFRIAKIDDIIIYVAFFM